MSDDRPWPGATRDDDLRVSRSDDDGEPTAPMSAVGDDEPPATGRPAAAPRVARPAPALPDGDEVPFWLLPPPPRPDAAATVPQAAAPPAIAPAPHTAPPPFQGRTDHHQPTVPVPGVPKGRPPAVPAAPPGRRSRASRPRTATGPGLLDRGAAVVDRAIAASGPLLRRVRALPPAWLAAGAAALAVVVVLVVVVGSLGGGDEGAPAAADTPSPSPSIVPVAASRITASASSVQEKAGRTTYEAANTLDGRPTTAWNSHGEKDGPGPGITLTYTFDEPVALRSIRVANGYQKDRGDGATFDLYDANSRLREVRVVTDGGEWTWELADKRAPQVLREDFGTPSSVTIEIVSVWPGSRFSDVGVSEVAFTAAREG
jgi:hypothetical protein